MTRSTENPARHLTTPRLFVAGALGEGAEIVASAEHTHYLGTVLRRTSGDLVRLFNGVDGEWTARLGLARRDRPSQRATFTVATRLRAQQPEPGPWLVFALLKREATDLAVRQAVELGVSRILPVITERTNTARVNDERLRAIATEAAEQSERLTLPEIDPPARLAAVLATWARERRLFAALERSWPATPAAAAGARACRAPREPGQCGDASAVAGVTPAQQSAIAGAAGAPRLDAKPVALLVGPEGGFTPAEHDLLRRLDFVTPISLGPYVLRAETAVVAGLALLLRMGWADYLPST